MLTSKSNIFRLEAVRCYSGAKDKSVFPKLIRPGVFPVIWLLSLLLSLGGVLAWTAKVPIYAKGIVIVIAADASHEKPSNKANLLVCLPAEDLTRLKVGQKVFFRLQSGTMLSRSILAVDSQVFSPLMIQERFALNSALLTKITGPTVVAFIAPGSDPKGPLTSFGGDAYEAQVEIGFQRLLANF